MKLPLITLLERMEKKPLGLESDKGLTVSGLRIITENTDLLEAGILYLSDSPKAHIRCAKYSMALYFCEPVRLPYCALFLPGARMDAVFNNLLETMDLFQKYEDRLNDIVYNDRDLQSYIILCSEIMGNPTYVVDSSFKVLAIDKGAIFSEISAIWRHLVDFGYLSYDIVAGLQSSEELTKMDAYRRAVLVNSVCFNNPFINFNLQKNGKTVGHFFTVGYCRAITAGDIAYADFLGRKLMPLLALDKRYAASGGKGYENFFIHVMSGTLKDQIQIKSQLKPLGWGYEGRYLVFVMRPKTKDELLIPAICARLEGIRDGKSVPYEGEIVTVFHLNEGEKRAYIESKLEQLVRTIGGVGGLSDEFDGFQRLANHFAQAKTAIALGGEETGKLHIYRDYSAMHIMKVAGERMNLNLVCERSIFRLRDYDRIHGSDYTQTLKVYLMNERSIVLTAEKLHIHRNTLLYRIGRLGELMDVDLNDSSVRQRIQLSFWALEYMDKAGKKPAERME